MLNVVDSRALSTGLLGGRAVDSGSVVTAVSAEMRV
jgi:hypothetical protein